MTISFAGTGSFQCKLDRKRWRHCKSPVAYRHLGRGKHVFRVRSGGSAATKRFRIR